MSVTAIKIGLQTFFLFSRVKYWGWEMFPLDTSLYAMIYDDDINAHINCGSCWHWLLFQWQLQVGRKKPRGFWGEKRHNFNSCKSPSKDSKNRTTPPGSSCNDALLAAVWRWCFCCTHTSCFVCMAWNIYYLSGFIFEHLLLFWSLKSLSNCFVWSKAHSY